MVDSRDLPTLLRVQRASRRLSQERTALAIGITFYRYRRLEAAMERPTGDELDALSRLFAVSVKALRSAVAATEYHGAGSGEAASVA